MEEDYWLKVGFKENGDLTCVRRIVEAKPVDNFCYEENGDMRAVKNPTVIKLTTELIKRILEEKNENRD